MPLLDHFHPPIKNRLAWETLHSAWATHIADALNEILPPEYFAHECKRLGAGPEIDIGTYEDHSPYPNAGANGQAAAVAPPQVWSPPKPTRIATPVFSDVTEIRVFRDPDLPRLVGAIELVSPRNKDRPEAIQAFVAKCASYLAEGASLIIVDVVTERRANLHHELMRLMEQEDPADFPTGTLLYSSAYRPLTREESVELEIWPVSLTVGQVLPTMPLRLIGDLFVPVDLESTYTQSCRKRRLI